MKLKVWVCVDKEGNIHQKAYTASIFTDRLCAEMFITGTDLSVIEGSLTWGQGFSRLAKGDRERVAAMGGLAVKPEDRSFSKDRELARSAGSKGGSNVPSSSRAFSKDPELARRAGKKGGTNSKRRKATAGLEK